MNLDQLPVRKPLASQLRKELLEKFKYFMFIPQKLLNKLVLLYKIFSKKTLVFF